MPSNDLITVAFKVTIQVSRSAWIAREGLGDDASAAEIRHDIREYFHPMIQGSVAAEDTDMVVWKGWSQP